MNNRGDVSSHVMILWFAFLLVVISIGIAGGVYIFFGGEYDFRQVEAGVLNHRIGECIVSGNFDKDNFYRGCGFDEDVLVENNKIKICKGAGDCISRSDWVFRLGSNFEVCGFDAAEKNKNFPRCAEGVYNYLGDKYVVITMGSQLRRFK